MSSDGWPQPAEGSLEEMADQIAADAASFVGAVEAVAAGTDPGAAVSVLILALSEILSSGAKLGAQEDVRPASASDAERDIRRAAHLGGGANTGMLRSALSEQFGGVDEYREVVDPYVGDEVATARLSDDLASIAGDLLQGLSLYTDARYQDAMAWWQYSYLSSWGAAASASLRALQSLIALVRLGAPMGAPGEDLPL